MDQDRIQFANNMEFKTSENFAKEICITHYFNELMAFYDLISLDQSSEHEGIENFWFENGGKNFAMNIEFGKKEKMLKFCKQLSIFNGIIFIYGLYYRLSFESKNKTCVVRLSVLMDDEDPRVQNDI